MKCSNCGNDMVRSRAGWLCISCGHVEADSSVPPIADHFDTAAPAAGPPPAEPTTNSDTPQANTPTSGTQADDTPAEPKPLWSAPGDGDQPASAAREDAPKPLEHQEPDPAPSDDPAEEPTGSSTTTGDIAPPPPSAAAPWEAPKASDDKAEDNAVDIAVGPKPATDGEAAPTQADLSAVEQAVAQVEEAAGAEEPEADSSAKPPSEDSADSRARPADDTTPPEPGSPLPPPVASEAPAPEHHIKHHRAHKHSNPGKRLDDAKDNDKDDKKDDDGKPVPESPADKSADSQDIAPETAAPETLEQAEKQIEDHPFGDAKADDEAVTAPAVDPTPETEAEKNESDPAGDDSSASARDTTSASASSADVTSSDTPDTPDTPASAESDPHPVTDATDTPADSASDATAPVDPAISDQATKSDPPGSVLAGEASTTGSEPTDSASADTSSPAAPKPSEPTDSSADAPAEAAPSPALDPAPTEPEPTPDTTPTPDDGSTSTPDASPASTLEPPPAAEPATTPTAPASALPTPDPAAPATPAAPVVSSNAPLNGKPPFQPVTHPRPVNTSLIVTIVIAALVLGIIGALVYLFLFEPKVALGGYLEHLVGAKTSAFATTVTQSSDGYRLALKLDGKYDLSDAAKPKLDVNATGELSADKPTTPSALGAASGSVSGRVIVAGQKFYFQIKSFSILTALLPIHASDTWYKYDLDTTQIGKCTNKGKGSGSFLGSEVLTQVPVKNASFAGLDSFDGNQALHYKGLIDNTKLQAAIDKANKNLSADCKLTIAAKDYKDLSVSYELWRGWSKDRLKLSVVDSAAKSTSDIILDTGAYDKPAKIEAPANAKDASTLISDFASGALSDTSPDQAATGGTAAQRANDTRRKTDIMTLRKALEEYFVNTGAYPATLADLTKTASPILKSVPADPTNKPPYTYIYVPQGGANSGYKLMACLENATDTTTNVIAPVAPCKTKTYQVESLN